MKLPKIVYPGAAVKHVVSPFGFADAVIPGTSTIGATVSGKTISKVFLGPYALFNPVQPASYAGQNCSLAQ
jgi:hypothetical protein